MGFFLLMGAMFAVVIAVTSGYPGQSGVDIKGIAYLVALICAVLAMFGPVAKIIMRPGRRFR